MRFVDVCISKQNSFPIKSRSNTSRHVNGYLKILGDVSGGNTINLEEIQDNCGENLIRLAEMGFTPFSPIKVIKNRGHGPMIIESRRIQIMIGRGLANKIMVTVV